MGIRYEVHREFFGYGSQLWSRPVLVTNTRFKWWALLVFKLGRRQRFTEHGQFVYRFKVVGGAE